MRFAALGRTEWLLASVRACTAHGHEPALVVSAPAEIHYAVGEDEFAAVARELGCPFLSTRDLGSEEAHEALVAAGADVAISVNWPTLIGPATRGFFPHGVVNAHAGDLPRFRGNAAPNWAIIAGEPRVVLTLHTMDDGLDSGPMLLKQALELGPRVTVGDVYAWLATAIPAGFAAVLDGIASAALVPQPQPGDPALSLRGLPRLPRDSELDWTRTGDDLDRLVRASSEPLAGATTWLGDRRLRVWRARPEAAAAPLLGTPGQVAELRADGSVAVLTGNGLLVLEEVSLDDGPRVPACAVIRSLRTRLGTDATQELLHLRARIAKLERRLAELDDRA